MVFNFANIKKFREEAGLTQEALAIAMSTAEDRVHVQQISDWENRTEGGINSTSIVKLCQALNKNVEDFFTQS